ncbi:VENN motif pre-toxin domain-containing protein [Pectobacteriaceae bacterium CE90]|nr:VENN motif pre-toxin domain-containing protein [Pectobacteriaceae bacterium CE90]
MGGGKSASELTEAEKQELSTLATVAGGLAAGLVGNTGTDAVAGAQAGQNAVENNALSVPENQNRAKEMTQCQGTEACSAVVEKYKKINAEQHESVVNCTGAQDCVDKANEVGRLQADYANRTNELMEKARANGSLSPEEQNELSILQVTSIQLEVDRNAAIHNVLMSDDSSEAKQLAINSLAQVAGTSAAGIAAGVGKSGKGNALPTSQATAAQNGLSYQSNPKHTPGQQGYSYKAGTEPNNSIDLFGSSIISGKKRYAKDADGNVHQFTNTNDGTWHWSGSTGDKSAPLNKNTIPSDVKKQLDLPRKGW